MINEDMHGNVKQLQAEVKKLKEQLALAVSTRCNNNELAPGGPQLHTGIYTHRQRILFKILQYEG